MCLVAATKDVLLDGMASIAKKVNLVCSVPYESQWSGQMNHTLAHLSICLKI